MNLNLLFIANLYPEDFYSLLPWFLGFIFVSSLVAYFSKSKVLYLFSILMFTIMSMKFFSFINDMEHMSKLYIYNNNKNLVFITKRNNVVINKYIIKIRNIHNLNIKNIIEKDRGSLSSITGSTFHYKAITYVDENKHFKELISTRNLFDNKYISVNNLEQIIYKIKEIIKN